MDEQKEELKRNVKTSEEKIAALQEQNKRYEDRLNKLKIKAFDLSKSKPDSEDYTKITDQISELEKKEEENKKKMQQIRAKAARQAKASSAKERKEDAHQKIVLGGIVLKVLGRKYREGDEGRLLAFLENQERRGSFFSTAMNKTEEKPRTTDDTLPSWVNKE